MEINVDLKVSDYWNIQLDLGKKMNQEQRGKKKKTQQTNPETFIGFGYIKYQQILKPSSAI